MTEQVRWLDRRKSYRHLLQKLTLAETRILMVLEEFANQKSVAWPARKTIAEMAFCSEKTVTRGLAKLVEVGILAVAREATIRTPTVYFVGPDAVPQSLRKQAQDVPPQGTKLCPPPGDIQMSPNQIRGSDQEKSTPHPPEAPPARVACAPVQSPASPEAIFAKLEAIGPVRNPFAAKVAIKTFLRAGGEPDDFRVLASASARRTREGFPRPGSRRVGLLVTWMNEEHRWRPQVCETRRAWETRAYRKRQAEEASRWWLSKASVPKGAQELVVELMRGVR